MKLIRVTLMCAAAGAMLAACTQGATGPPSIHSVNPLTNSKLQLVVGTANFGGVHGLNVVSTLRQPNGNSAVLVDTPTLTGPFTLPAAQPAGSGIDQYSTLPSGPSVEEVAAGGTISATSQFVRPGTPVCDSTTPCGGIAPNTTTLGQSGGAFGMGLAPYNSNINGTATSIVPFATPMFDTTGNAFTAWGGPPAFDPNHDNMGVRDGLFALCADPSNGCSSGFLLGIGEGISIFEHVTPATGTYTLSVAIPTSPTTSGTISTTATLTSAAFLPNAAIPAFVSEDGLGSVVLNATLPAGANEGYVEIIDFGGGAAACQGSTGASSGLAVYYTIHITASGPVTLPDNDGPNLNTTGGTGNLQASPSLCAGDAYQAYLVAFDYPLFAASYPNSLGNQTPTLAGSNGQADISVSRPFSSTY